MSQRLRAIFTSGAFVPLPHETPVDVPENSEVESRSMTLSRLLR